MNAKEVLAENGGIGTAAATYVLRALRAAAGGADRVVLCWDGDECILRGALDGGSEMIATERRRQVEAEGWTPQHDAEHTGGELGHAAIAYAIHAYSSHYGGAPPGWWPWERSWWKPSPDPIRNLVKAGALIAAEIDRLTDVAVTSPEEDR